MIRVANFGAGNSRRLYRVWGYLLISIGLLLLAAAGGYWAFAEISKSQLGDQNVSIPLQPPDFPTSFERIDPEAIRSSGLLQQAGDPGSRWRIPSPEEYRPVDWATVPRTVGVQPAATRISIPAIDVTSTIVELGTVWEDGKLVWERPINAVGHHQGTPNPGEAGNVVMSGHRSSPLRGEGAVFRKLGDVPDLLTDSASSGENVDIFLYTPETVYVYRAISTQVVKPEQVNVFHQTAEPTLTLITCTPDLVYSHRLILTALLVATVPA